MEKPPLEILDRVIAAGYMFKCRPAYSRPGSIISRLSDDSRKILVELRSADIATLRTDFVRLYLPEPDPSRRLALDFDARIPRHFRL